MIEYSFYTDEFHGSLIPDTEWPGYESQAQARMRKYKDIYTVEPFYEDAQADPESMAICAMAEELYSFDALLSSGNEPKSISVGSVSTSYGQPQISASELTTKARDKRIYEAAKLYLRIYRGVC